MANSKPPTADPSKWWTYSLESYQVGAIEWFLPFLIDHNWDKWKWCTCLFEGPLVLIIMRTPRILIMVQSCCTCMWCGINSKKIQDPGKRRIRHEGRRWPLQRNRNRITKFTLLGNTLLKFKILWQICFIFVALLESFVLLAQGYRGRVSIFVAPHLFRNCEQSRILYVYGVES